MLIDAAKHTLFATSADMLRPAMTGVYCLFDQYGSTFVATDAHKLAKYTHGAQSYESTDFFILPRKAFGILKGSLPTNNTEVSITINKANATFSYDDTEMTCSLVDSRYPDFNVVIPSEDRKKMTIDKNELVKAIKRALIFSSKATNEVAMDIKQDELKVHSQDIDSATNAIENLSCEYDGDTAIQIAFNGKFILDVLSAIDAETVEFRMTENSRPCVIVPAQLQGLNTHVLMLLMPIMRHH